MLDYGVKRSIIEEMARRGCTCTILPAQHGSGDDRRAAAGRRPPLERAGRSRSLIPLLGTVRHCIDRYPTLAICLGHQLAALALGGQVKKLPFGHHGANHPVQNLRTGRVSVTAQNHNYAVEADLLPSTVELTHSNVNDGTIEGFTDHARRLWSVQFHPEGAPGPRDSSEIFDDFVRAVTQDGRTVPRSEGIGSVLVLGSGPIVIGQACEFDYSGTQAVKALREEGCRVILVNSNPATIMTDPGLADATYIEPLTAEYVAKVVARERPDACLATVGGQTALNLPGPGPMTGRGSGTACASSGPRSRPCALPRIAWRSAGRCGTAGSMSRSARTCKSIEEAERALEATGLPAIIRPSFTLGGTGSGVALDLESFRKIVRAGSMLSPVGEVLIEESLLGWKEFEFEVMRDCADQTVVVCSIENLDPMGIHTGDSITVAPAMTLTDRELQEMRDDAFRVIRDRRGRDGRQQHPVRRPPADPPPRRDRDEPPRLSLLRARQQGDRLPDREDRGPPGARLRPRRDRQRHHPQDDGLLRAGPRLRGRQDPALELREVPRDAGPSSRPRCARSAR